MVPQLLNSFQRIAAIERVALGRDEAGVGDDAAEFAFVGAIFYAGGEDDVFFDEDATDVVGAELQTDLADFNSGRKPAGLDVVDVVEVEAADGQRFQIIDGSGFLHFFSKRGIFGGKHPRNEGGETAGIFLNAPQPFEMVDAMAQLFAAAEHHGGGGAQSQRMGHAVHFFPVITRALQTRNFRADFVVENFRAAARNGLQPRVHQPLNRFADADFADFRDAQNFGRRKTMQMHLRIARFQGAQQIFVIADLQVRVQPALEQNSGAAEFQHFVDFLVDFLEREDVAVLGAERTIERAEGAILGAEIGVVDVAVDLVGDDAGVVFLKAHLVRGHAEAYEVVGFEHVKRLLFGQSQD